MKKIIIGLIMISALNCTSQNYKKFRQQFTGGVVLIGTGSALMWHSKYGKYPFNNPPQSNPDYYKGVYFIGVAGVGLGIVGVAVSTTWLKRENLEIETNITEIKLTYKF